MNKKMSIKEWLLLLIFITLVIVIGNLTCYQYLIYEKMETNQIPLIFTLFQIIYGFIIVAGQTYYYFAIMPSDDYKKHPMKR